VTPVFPSKLRTSKVELRTILNGKPSSLNLLPHLLITGTIFALAPQPKNPPMHAALANLEIKVLEKMYLNEVEVLKLKLLSGAFWKDIKRQNDKTLELAQTIHQKQFDKLVLSLG
jgi:hypothetical protein